MIAVSVRGKSSWFVVGLAIVFLLFHASLGFRLVKPPHPDEFWTMDTIAAPLSTTFEIVMRRDNHPPLFYVLAGMWRSVVGPELNAIRTLPYLFSCGSILSFSWFLRDRSLMSMLLAMGLVGTNPLFVYYSATLRPYSLLVLMSTLVTCCLIRLRDTWSPYDNDRKNAVTLSRTIYYISIIGLSLSHYFGFAFAVILTVLNFVEKKAEPRRWRSVALLVGICAWPFVHFFFGALGGQAVHNQWVTVVPFVSTFNNFLMAVFPLISISKQPQIMFASIMAFVFLLIYLCEQRFSPMALVSSLRSKTAAISNESYFTIAITILIAAAILVDMRKPLSTPYYFLVCLPPVAILFSRIFEYLLLRNLKGSQLAYLALLIAILILQVVMSYQRLASL
jgi:uncharacterized membrane protein